MKEDKDKKKLRGRPKTGNVVVPSKPSKKSSKESESVPATPESSNDESEECVPEVRAKLMFKNKNWKGHPSVILKANASRVWPRLKQIIQMENYSKYPFGIETYTNIEAPPSLLPPKKYCDITGFQAPYRDPKTGLRYCSAEVYQIIRHFSINETEKYLSLRNAQSILK